LIAFTSEEQFLEFLLWYYRDRNRRSIIEEIIHQLGVTFKEYDDDEVLETEELVIDNPDLAPERYPCAIPTDFFYLDFDNIHNTPYIYKTSFDKAVYDAMMR